MKLTALKFMLSHGLHGFSNKHAFFMQDSHNHGKCHSRKSRITLVPTDCVKLTVHTLVTKTDTNTKLC